MKKNCRHICKACKYHDICDYYSYKQEGLKAENKIANIINAVVLIIFAMISSLMLIKLL